MATKKDLVEAYSFSRRRLVTAFVSGAPGGREVEPTKPGRMLVGGVALAILLIAGAAVAGALTGRPDPDLEKSGLVTDDHGALYVILGEDQVPGDDPRLRPVINVTSAQLILGAGQETRKVKDEILSEAKKGPSIGILDAPATVPDPESLVNTGWTSCTATDYGIKTEVSDQPQVERTPRIGFVVRAAGTKKRYLIAEASHPDHPTRAYSYELPGGNIDPLLDGVGASPGSEITVPDQWLALFPPGGPLTPAGLGISNWGKPVTTEGYPAGTRVGDIEGNRNSPYLITSKGPVQLTPFAEAVVKATPVAGRTSREVEPTEELDAVPSTYADSLWPSERLADSANPTDQICGVLETAEDTQPAVQLGTFPQGSAMLTDVDAGELMVTVSAGHGALVHSADWASTDGGSVQLIDERGRTYSVAGDQEVENLGYGSVPEVVVPDAWNRLFRAGPDLSILAALCPPKATGESEADAGATCS